MAFNKTDKPDFPKKRAECAEGRKFVYSAVKIM